MKKIPLVLSLIALSSVALADHHHGKGLGAHAHGSIKLGMAVEGKTIELDLDGPAESFFGFEYAPKTAKEKKSFSDAQNLWNKELLSKLITLDKKLGCTTSAVSFTQEIEKEGSNESGVHSDVEAKAKIICTQDLKGQTALVSIKKFYPQIKKLSIDLIGSETKTIDSSASESIKL